jgi:hypothetical protein
VLERWDGSLFADAATSTTLEPGQVIFGKWLSEMKVKTFGDELGADIVRSGMLGTGNQLTNMLIHVLDEALDGGSGVPPSRDYFNAFNPSEVMSAAFDQALAALGTDPNAWSTQLRDIVDFKHTLSAIPKVATLLDSNRANYTWVVVLSNPKPNSESILSLGQSGFIKLAPPGTPVFDIHFADRLQLYRVFGYRPMNLFDNAQFQK